MQHLFNAHMPLIEASVWQVQHISSFRLLSYFIWETDPKTTQISDTQTKRGWKGRQRMRRDKWYASSCASRVELWHVSCAPFLVTWRFIVATVTCHKLQGRQWEKWSWSTIRCNALSTYNREGKEETSVRKKTPSKWLKDALGSHRDTCNSESALKVAELNSWQIKNSR